jgi:hypothetical protein
MSAGTRGVDTRALDDVHERADHLAWCKRRAKDYLDNGDTAQAWLSFTSDMNKHSGTAGHPAVMDGTRKLFSGKLMTAEVMRRFIDGIE